VYKYTSNAQSGPPSGIKFTRHFHQLFLKYTNVYALFVQFIYKKIAIERVEREKMTLT